MSTSGRSVLGDVEIQAFGPRHGEDPDMKAIRHHRTGGPEVLVLDEMPDPTPGPDQVVIAVEAAGVHVLDTALRAGRAPGFPMPDLPTVPGREVAGRVDAVGPGVDDDWLSRLVVAHLGASGSGGYAQRAVAPVDALHELDDGTDPAAAITMIGTGRTALLILDTAELGADDVVLVLAAAGGLGTLLVQSGLDVGATVIGAAGGRTKASHVHELGALAVDYTDAEWASAVADTLDGRDLTVVMDGVGGTIGRDALELLAPGGRHVLFGWSSGDPTPLDATDLLARGIDALAAIGPQVRRAPGGMRRLEARALEALTSGRWRPAVTSFELADAAEAHRALEQRRTTGKVVLRP